ncbi:MAG TPA: YbhB/YbcL family Raf kinase inhibitor-like protein [Chloroflexota bacterium]|nr:YbhB/YbcL family Raf kinase inhibitor-like protein [Chloroflexota bacterium]
MALTLSSPMLTVGGEVPERFTCLGEDISPPLDWDGAPSSTHSLALTLRDPDAPRGTFTHWLVYNLPADSSGLMEGIPSDRQLPNGAYQGTNSFGKIGYGGPCPPAGPAHRYIFTLYALKQAPTLQPGADIDDFLHAIDGQIADQTELTTLFARPHETRV